VEIITRHQQVKHPNTQMWVLLLRFLQQATTSIIKIISSSQINTVLSIKIRSVSRLCDNNRKNMHNVIIVLYTNMAGYDTGSKQAVQKAKSALT
jgi:hypothetical protein